MAEKLKKDKQFDKLSDNARLSIRYAKFVADELFSLEVTPLHIFVGILMNEESLGARSLRVMGIDLKTIIEGLVGPKFDKVPKGLQKEPSEIKLSKESKDSLRIAYSIASKHAHVYVGTEHLLLSIFEQGHLKVSKDLAKMGINSKFYQENLANFATYPIGILSKPEQRLNEDGTESQLSILGKDLVQMAMEGRLDPLVGRDDELDQVINVLSRRSKNNPIIVGNPGVGKTAIVEGLAQLIAAGTVPNSLLNLRIINLDLSAIIAGSKLRGDVEEKMISIINEVVESENTILFIDEIHNILGGGMMGGGMDIASVLKPALLRDDSRFDRFTNQ